MSKLAGMIEAYLAGPGLLRKATAGMSPEQLKATPVAGKMSTLEVVCHIADFEPVYLDRIQRTIALDKPLVFGADPELFRAALVYHERDNAEEIDFIEATRRHVARLLRGRPDEVLARQCVHSSMGLLTLETLLTNITNHIPHHIRFIDEKRAALGLT